MLKIFTSLWLRKQTIREIIQYTPLFVVILLILFLIKFLWISLFEIEGSNPVNNIGNTNDIKPIDWNSDFTWSIDTWINIQPSTDIDIVYDIIKDWKPWEDYSAISFKPQTKKWSEWWYIDSAILKDEYLPNNRYSLTVPNDITWWYLYIKTRQPLKFMSSIWVYRPITIWTNILDTRNMRIYGRIDTKKSLPVYQWNQEFLYKLDNIPIAKSTTDSWLGMKWKTLQIWWFVWDVSWNGIDKIISCATKITTTLPVRVFFSKKKQ